MTTYKVIRLQNISDGDGGWEVNDAHYTGDEIELGEDTGALAIMKAMKACGQFAKHVTRRMFYIDAEISDGGSIWLRLQKDHRWLYELRPVVQRTEVAPQS